MKVSVVTPSFNQAPYIRRTLESVLGQDWPDLEHVVFDGASTDGTLQILEQFGNRLKWVSKSDKGQADAVNRAILATDGDVIGWLNSDDVYYSGAVRLAVEYLSANPEIDVVYGMADHIDVNDVPYEPYPTEPWNFERLKWTCFICQPAAFFRRRVVHKYGLLNVALDYCMDYEYWLRLAAAGARFGYLEKKLAGSRMYRDNKTVSSRIAVHREINDMFRQSFGRVPDRWLQNYAYLVTQTRVDRTSRPNIFILVAGLRLIATALRWNHSNTAEMRREAFELIARFFRTARASRSA
jgi:glycosyltransferase involved in cell wall biosynthesis